jgi:hypothetical protein
LRSQRDFFTVIDTVISVSEAEHAHDRLEVN